MPDKSEIAGLIEKHKAAMAAGPLAQDQLASALDKLQDELELLGQEDAEIRKGAYLAIIEHTAERTKELKIVNELRKTAVYSCLAFIVMISGMFAFVLLCPLSKSNFEKWTDWPKVAFIGGTFLACFGLLGLMLRGVFTPKDAGDATAGIPEGLKSLGELAKAMTGKSS
jgi:hypothetical protein